MLNHYLSKKVKLIGNDRLNYFIDILTGREGFCGSKKGEMRAQERGC
jgi:hypothetical protein